MSGRLRVVLATFTTSIALAGCLFRTAEAPRFYRPASAVLDGVDDEDAGVAAPAATGAVPIRVPSVRSAPFLRERIVWRSSPVEYGLYEQRRWFELPSRYVRRALTSALRDAPGLRVGDATAAARLDVEILAFDEVLAPRHEAHVLLAVVLREGTETRLNRTFAAASPVAGDDGGAVALAMGSALDVVVRDVAATTARVLAPAPAAPPRKTRSH